MYGQPPHFHNAEYDPLASDALRVLGKPARRPSCRIARRPAEAPAHERKLVSEVFLAPSPWCFRDIARRSSQTGPALERSAKYWRGSRSHPAAIQASRPCPHSGSRGRSSRAPPAWHVAAIDIPIGRPRSLSVLTVSKPLRSKPPASLGSAETVTSDPPHFATNISRHTRYCVTALNCLRCHRLFAAQTRIRSLTPSRFLD